VGGARKTKVMPAEIERGMGYYRCQMKEVEAVSMLRGPAAVQATRGQAFRPDQDFSQMNGVWLRFSCGTASGRTAPAVGVGGCGSERCRQSGVMLVQSGPAVLPTVREASAVSNETVKERAIRIVAWQVIWILCCRCMPYSRQIQ